MVIIKCAKCGKEFRTYSSSVLRGRKFCSLICAYSEGGRRKRPSGLVNRVCKVCDKEFKTQKSWVKKGSGITCSRACQAKWKTTRKKLICKGCGKEYEQFLSFIKMGRRYCSPKCWYAHGLPQTQKEMTNIERIMMQELDRREIAYKTQQWIEDISLVDFLLPNKIIIQCDGDYWHSLPNVKRKDTLQDKKLQAQGYTIYRFWGSQILISIKSCINTILGDEEKPRRKRPS